MQNRVKFDISISAIVKIILAFLAIWFIYEIREILVLFFIVLVIVAALGPLVDRMARYIPRFLAVLIISIIFIGILVAIGFLILPPLINQIQEIAINLPFYVDKISPFYNSLRQTVTTSQQSLFDFTSQLGNVTGGIYSTTISFITGIVGIFTILVLSFYMLLEKEAIKRFFIQTFPSEHQERALEVIRKIGTKMGSWLRGQAILMLIIGVLDGIVLLSLGIPFALTLAVWGGLVEVIPYIGPWLGLIPAAIIAFTISPLTALILVIAYIVIQQLEGQFLVPKIMGKAVGLSPVIIILVLLIGAKLEGILGILIAVPVAAALSVLIQEWAELKKIWTNS